MGNQRSLQTKTTIADRHKGVAITPKPLSSTRTPVHPLLQLQRQIGNQAVSHLIQAKLKVGKPNDTYEQEADRVADTVMRMPDSLVQRQAEENKEETAQAKSSVGQISPLVQRQAEEKKEETAQTKSLIGSITPLVQRQATEEKKDEHAQMLQRQAAEEKKDESAQMLQRQAAEEKKDESAQMLQRQAAEEKKDESAQMLQRQAAEEKKDEHAQMLQRQAAEEKKDEYAQAKGVADQTPEVTPALEGRIQTIRGGGQSLPESTRTFFESRFGYDFGGVRVHTDSQAAETASHLNAQAFTIGRDVFFGAGRYAPHTSQGRWLLAHELTHTLQQNPTQPLTAKRKIVQPQSEGGHAHPPLRLQKNGAIAISQNSNPTIQRKVSGGKAPASPAQDPAFQAVVKKAKAAATQQKHHAPAKSKATEAQAAAVPPANDVASKAAGKQVQQMDQQQPKAFNRNAFKAALLAKIAASAPKNLEEADKFKESGKLGAVKGDLTGQVDTTKKQSQGAIEAKVKGTPDPSGIEPKSVAPVPPNQAGAPPAGIDAAQAAPKPKTDAEVSLQEGSQSLDKQMVDAEVTDDQLKKSNEPDFQTAADAKQQAQKDAVTAPQEYRQSEQSVLTQAKSQAVTTAQTQLTGMHTIRGQAQNKTTTAQQQAKNQDEQKRTEVANELQVIYTQTKKAAEDRLTRLDTEVNQAFDKGATAAQQAFEDYVKRRMDAYKDARYSGISGPALWLKDKLLSLPAEVNAFYQEGRQLYITKMDAVLDGIAILVEKGLNEAKDEIARGRKAIQTKLEQQPANLRKALQQDAEAIQNQFDQLEKSVEDKQNQLIDSLAQKYNEKLQAIDARIEEMKAQNKGWVDAASDALGGVIKTILELKNMLLGVLGRASAAIKKIIKDPIGFLGNLVAGVKQGFMNFVGNIATHLQKGLMGWLFGALAEAGIQLPESFDLKGILNLVMQVLGATWAFIRARAVKILGEKVVQAMETTAEIFKILITQGVVGVWEYIKEQLSSLKDVVIEGIKSFVTDSIIKAGVTWIIGLLNPAGAFIKACKAIYDIIMFFVERGSQIIALVNAVVDSVSAIADGAIGVAAKAVEDALAKAVPVVISFLAALLGVTGISKKIREVIEKVQAPVGKAIDWLINKAYSLVKATGKLLGFGKDKKDPKRDGSSKTKLQDTEIGKTISFGSKGKGHRLWIITQGTSVTVMVASEAGPLEAKIIQWSNRLKDLGEGQQAEAKGLLATARQHLGVSQQEGMEAAKNKQKLEQNPENQQAVNEFEKADDKVEETEQSLADTLKRLFELFGDKATSVGEFYKNHIEALRRDTQTLQSRLSKLQKNEGLTSNLANWKTELAGVSKNLKRLSKESENITSDNLKDLEKGVKEHEGMLTLYNQQTEEEYGKVDLTTGQKDEALHTALRSVANKLFPVDDLKKVEPSKDSAAGQQENEGLNVVASKIREVQMNYETAKAASVPDGKTWRNRTFEFQGTMYYVCESNGYIVPAHALELLEKKGEIGNVADAKSKLLDAESKLSKAHRYRNITVGELNQKANQIFPSSKKVNADHYVVLFLAVYAAEPIRNNLANVVNIAMLGGLTGAPDQKLTSMHPLARGGGTEETAGRELGGKLGTGTRELEVERARDIVRNAVGKDTSLQSQIHRADSVSDLAKVYGGIIERALLAHDFSRF